MGYDYKRGIERIDSILKTNDSYEEIDKIPADYKLTFNNGFYINCSALFVDIRKSSKLTSNHNRPKLAKLYRAYISEVVAIMNKTPLNDHKIIKIIGDGILGIFNTPSEVEINSIFNMAAQISSLIRILNCRLKKQNIQKIKWASVYLMAECSWLKQDIKVVI